MSCFVKLPDSSTVSGQAHGDRSVLHTKLQRGSCIPFRRYLPRSHGAVEPSRPHRRPYWHQDMRPSIALTEI